MSAGTDTLDSVQTALINAGVGQKINSANDWMIYKGFLQDADPKTPKSIADRAICLYETPGLPPLEAWKIVYPGVQVSVRGAPDEYTLVREKIQDVFTVLHANEVAISSDFVFFYAQQSGPLSMGRDERRRPSLAWNFRSMRKTPVTVSP